MGREANIDAVREIHRASAINILANDLKNRRKHPYFPLTVIEDFLTEPKLWRHFALSQEYHMAERETYPGIRSRPLNELDPELFESFARKLLHHLPMFRGFSNIRASFHLTEGSYVKGWIHDDDPKVTLSGLVYLNPTAPPNTGTLFFDDTPGEDPSGEFTDIIEKDTLVFDAEERQTVNKYRDAQREKFTLNAKIENVFNRCIVFDPRVWHCPDEFFGTTKEDSRLTLVWTATA